jgi:hypothetical protein
MSYAVARNKKIHHQSPRKDLKVKVYINIFCVECFSSLGAITQVSFLTQNNSPKRANDRINRNFPATFANRKLAKKETANHRLVVHLWHRILGRYKEIVYVCNCLWGGK